LCPEGCETHLECMSPDGNPNIAILADDLTSAADGAGPFVSRGLSASVGRRAAPFGHAQVLAVDVASRSMGEENAARQTAAAAAELCGTGVLYKTVDSTLRGHVRAEICAALRGSGRRRLVFAPAFPEMRRTTEGGVQLVDGVPVDRSPYGRDPVHPARTANLADLIPAEARDTILLDAQSQDELDRKVAEIDQPEEILWVGSPGMAHALAKRFAPESRRPTMPVRCQGRLLVVVGSANGVSHRQADAVRGRRDITVLRAPVGRGDNPARVLAALTGNAALALGEGTFGALLATGGDTMNAILDSLEIGQFDLLGEIEPGFPIGLAQLAGRKLLLGMKAGGFGNDDTLASAADRLIGQEEELEL